MSDTKGVDPDVETKEEKVEEVLEPTKGDKERELMLKDLHEFKQRALKLESDLKERDKLIKEKEESDLAKEQEWQKLAEMRASERDQAKEELNGLRDSLVMNKKMTALELVANNLGIRDVNDVERFGLINDVVVESTSTGKVNVLGAEEAIKKLKADKPYLFKSGGSSLNPADPEVVSGKSISFSDIEKERLKAEETGDYTPYKAIMNKYRMQDKHNS